MTTAKRMYQMLSENVSKSESKMLKNETINSYWKKPKSTVVLLHNSIKMRGTNIFASRFHFY